LKQNKSIEDSISVYELTEEDRKEIERIVDWCMNHPIKRIQRNYQSRGLQKMKKENQTKDKDDSTSSKQIAETEEKNNGDVSGRLYPDSILELTPKEIAILNGEI
jgi:hypothetical protein